MKTLEKNEELLKGGYVLDDSSNIEDEVFRRIVWLVSEKLNKISSDGSGWRVLYQDPSDNRFWELTYPFSEMHGGGPPQLKCISLEEAKGKFFIKNYDAWGYSKILRNNK